MYFPCTSAEDCLKLFHTTFDHVPWTVSISDINQPDEPTIYVNRGFTLLTGYEWNEIVGRNCRLLQGSDLSQKGSSILRSAINANESGRAKVKNYHKNGQPFWNLVRLIPIQTDNPDLHYILGLQLDVSWMDGE
jgi:PAS domain S-box-containing protein